MMQQTLRIVALLLFVASAAASHNDLDVRSSFNNQITYYTYNIGYGYYLLNDTFTSGTEASGGLGHRVLLR